MSDKFSQFAFGDRYLVLLPTQKMDASVIKLYIGHPELF